MPKSPARRSAFATISCSSRRCRPVWGMGTYSSLEITWVGTGRWRSSHASRSDLRIHPLWTWGFEQDGTVFGLGIFTTGTTVNFFIGQRLLLHDSVYNCYAPFAPDGFFVNLNGGSGRRNCERQGGWNP